MKEKIRERVTVLDHAQDEIERVGQERKRRDQANGETIVKLLAELKIIDGDLIPLEERLASSNREYFELRAEQGEKIKARIAMETVSPEDLKTGKVTPRDYYERGCSAETIERDANLQAKKELTPLRIAIKDIGRKVVELREVRARNVERIETLRADEAINFHHSLGAIQKELEMAGAYSLTAAAAHQAFLKAQGERLLTSGFPGMTKIWTGLKSMAEIEALETDPAIAEEHLDGFRRVVEEIRASNFQRQVTINYNRVPSIQGPAGTFWWNGF